MLEVLDAAAAAVGEDRVGVRLCPYNVWMDATDSIEAAVEKNVWLMQELNRRLPGLAYMHMVRPSDKHQHSGTASHVVGTECREQALCNLMQAQQSTLLCMQATSRICSI
jgi:2,4-dienoyl-CoA reductase-like NADH-dependent reductase (Old Yellow Enzyme family)